jgi:hypothetical protein
MIGQVGESSFNLGLVPVARRPYHEPNPAGFSVGYFEQLGCLVVSLRIELVIDRELHGALPAITGPD